MLHLYKNQSLDVTEYHTMSVYTKTLKHEMSWVKLILKIQEIFQQIVP